ncbi:MAG: UPF0280 family protein [Candidatus Nezhaarchaeota archaeon]|nr:UPF0280 family protein [Candidatus Nezhaarchaeota archaeon]
MSGLHLRVPGEGDKAPVEMRHRGGVVSYKQSMLRLTVDRPELINVAYSSLLTHRLLLDSYVELRPDFKLALSPVKVEPWAPPIARLAAEAAEIAGVGPMAAIAGAVAQAVMGDLIRAGARIAVVENGGEIAALSNSKLTVAVYAGPSPLSMKLGFELDVSDYPVGIATSSATVSRSISFGQADAAVAVANEASIADAAAKAICNAAVGSDSEAAVSRALEAADELKPYIRGALVIKDKHVGLTGRLPRLVRFRA